VGSNPITRSVIQGGRVVQAGGGSAAFVIKVAES